ncbi:MAG: O-antigen ligase family protein [Micromonosporaceae bacterium]
MTTPPVHAVDLEPSLIAERTYTTRRRRALVDVPVVLSFTIALLFVLPEGLILPNLPLVGRPGLIVAMLLFSWWALARLNPWLVVVGPQPLRWLVLAYMIAFMLSYLAGTMRGLTSLEQNGQDTAVLSACAFIGILLMAADGIPNWERLRGVLRVFVWCAGFMAIVGLLQGVLKIDVTRYLLIPGLQLKGELAGLENRGANQFRVAGTALHFIEFSAVMAMTVPYAIHLARFSASRLHRRLAAAVALLAAAAVPMSISRTGVIALAVAILVMLPAWGWRLRYNIMAMAVGMLGVLMVVRPGLVGTIRSMFTSAGSDPSITGRTERYGLIGHWFGQRPWLGRGPFSVVPGVNGGIVFDNQWLYTLVTQGIVGAAALAALHIGGITLATIAYRRSQEAEVRHLCVALISTQLIAILSEGTYDAFYFTTYSSVLALLLGVSGAVWRFTHPARTVRTSAVRRSSAELAPAAPG